MVGFPFLNSAARCGVVGLLVLLLCPALGFASGTTTPVVMAPFFYWYDDASGAHLRDWASTASQVTVEPPNLQPGHRSPGYSWQNMAWMREELLAMREAGIDVALAVWFGHEPPGTWPEAGLKNLLEAALQLEQEGKNPPKIGLFYDTSAFTFEEAALNPGKPWTLDLTTPENKRRFYEMLRRFWAGVCEVPYVKNGPPLGLDLWKSRFAPVLARSDGYPVTIIYEAGRGNFFSDWDHSLFDLIQTEFEKDFGVRPRLFPDYEWWYKNPHQRELPFDLNGGGYVRWRAAVYEPFAMDEPVALPRKGMDAIQFGPGYDDRRFPERTKNGSPVRSRDNGYFYCYGWQYAHRSGKQVALIESWNELHEGTPISDSRQYGRSYIRLNARLAEEFRRSYREETSVTCLLMGRNEDGLSVINEEQGLYQVDGGVLRSSDQPYGQEEADYIFDPPPATDGKTVATWKNGSQCRRTDLPLMPRIYFDVRDEFTSGTAQEELWVTVEYCDVGTDSLRLIWGEGEEGTEAVRKTGSGAWVSHTFEVKRDAFSNAMGLGLNHMIYQKLGCDFAIDSMGDGNEYVRRVTVSRAAQARGTGVSPVNDIPAAPSAQQSAPFAVKEGLVHGRDARATGEKSPAGAAGFAVAVPTVAERGTTVAVAITALRADGTTDSAFQGKVILRTLAQLDRFPTEVWLGAQDGGTTTVSGVFEHYGENALVVQAAESPERMARHEVFVPVPRCETVLGVNGAERGLRLLMPPGVPAATDCFRSSREAGGKLVFDAADSLYSRLGEYPSYYNLYVTIEYLDIGQGEFQVYYDSNDEYDPPVGEKLARTQTVRRTDTGQWREATVFLEDPWFENRCLGGDFAIDDGGQDLRVRRVRLNVAPPADRALRLGMASEPAGEQGTSVSLWFEDEAGAVVSDYSSRVRLIAKSGGGAEPVEMLLGGAGLEKLTVTVPLTGEFHAYDLADPSISSFEGAGFAPTGVNGFAPTEWRSAISPPVASVGDKTEPSPSDSGKAQKPAASEKNRARRSLLVAFRPERAVVLCLIAAALLYRRRLKLPQLSNLPAWTTLQYLQLGAYKTGFSWQSLQRRRPYLVAALLALLFFSPRIVFESRINAGDYFDWHLPVRWEATEAIRDGRLPHWTWHVFGGFPFLSDPQSAVFYPGNLLLAAVTETVSRNSTFDYYVILHFVMMAMGAVFLARSLALGPHGAVVTACVITFNGYNLLHLGHVNIIQSLAVGTWALGAIARAVRLKSVQWAVGAGLLMAAVILAGHPQTALFLLYMAFGGGISLSVREGVRTKSLKPVWLGAGLLLIMAGVALGASAVQVLPTLELLGHTGRSQLKFDEAAALGLPLGLFPALWFPGLYMPLTWRLPASDWWWTTHGSWAQLGNWEFLMHSGFIAWVLGVFGWRCHLRRPLVHVLLITGVLTWLASTGKDGGIYALLFEWAPGFEQVRIPPRMLFVSFMAWGLLAGLGADALVAARNEKSVRAAARWTAALVCLMLIAGAVVLLRARLAADGWHPVFERLFAPDPIHPLKFLRRADLFVADITWQIALALATMVFCIAFFLKGASARSGRFPAFFAIVITGAVFAELALYGAVKNIGLGMTAVDIRKAESLRAFQSPPEGRFISHLTGFRETAVYNANLALACDLEFMGGYNPLVLSWVAPFLPGAEPGHSGLEDLWNIRYLLERTVADEGREPAPTAESLGRSDYRKTAPPRRGWQVLERNAPGFAWLVPEARRIKHNPQELGRVRSEILAPGFDPRRTVIVDKDRLDGIEISKFNAPRPDLFSGQAEVSRESPERYRVKTRSNQPGWLVLSQAWYPGWEAWLNGKKTRVTRANGAQIAIAVPAGEHKVKLKFETPDFKKGAAVSVITWIWALLFLLKKGGRLGYRLKHLATRPTFSAAS